MQYHLAHQNLDTIGKERQQWQAQQVVASQASTAKPPLPPLPWLRALLHPWCPGVFGVVATGLRPAAGLDELLL